MEKLFLIFLLTLFILVLAGAGCAPPRPTPVQPTVVPESQTAISMESKKVSLVTSDEVTIIGQYNKPAGASRAVLLLHMMPATKESWQPLSELLNKKRIAALAIDLRGHGESTAGRGGRVLDYKKFVDEEHQASRLDVAASLDFLQREGFVLSNLAVVGASIGANFSLTTLAEYPQIKKAAALSPGLDFRGVKPGPAVKNLSAGQAVFLAAAEDDSYSADTVRALSKETQAGVTVKIYPEAGHGTNMWEAEPSLLPEIADWILE